jgi:iron-sulfur cluster assembly accessory protein
MNTIITLTDAAAAHIKTMLTKSEKAIGFRLSIKKTGCSGYAYLPDLVETAKDDDIHFIAQNGVHVFVDPSCEKFIKDVVVDYVEDNHAGIKQKRLVFINPNEKNRCGCGESFTIE